MNIKIFFEKLYISFEANLVIYKNKINIPPIIIIKIIYENQNEYENNPIINEILIVWIIKINPIDIGWFKNINVRVIVKFNIINKR